MNSVGNINTSNVTAADFFGNTEIISMSLIRQKIYLSSSLFPSDVPSLKDRAIKVFPTDPEELRAELKKEIEGLEKAKTEAEGIEGAKRAKQEKRAAILFLIGTALVCALAIPLGVLVNPGLFVLFQFEIFVIALSSLVFDWSRVGEKFDSLKRELDGLLTRLNELDVEEGRNSFAKFLQELKCDKITLQQLLEVGELWVDLGRAKEQREQAVTQEEALTKKGRAFLDFLDLLHFRAPLLEDPLDGQQHTMGNEQEEVV